MDRNLEETDMSEMEREFELEMEEEPSGEAELEAAFESLGDRETEPSGERELEAAFESLGDQETEPEGYLTEGEYEEEPLGEFEAEPVELELEAGTSDYGERFFELAQREFESDSERDASVHELVREMEVEYFWSTLLKKGGSALASRFKKAVKGHPAFGLFKSVAKQLAGPLSGNLGALASAALSVYPGGAALLPLLKSFGFDKGQGDPRANKEAWNNFVSFSREAYEHLADNVTERELRDPAAAAQRASQAMAAARQAAAGRMAARPGFRGRQVVGGASGGRRRPVYRVRVPRGAIAHGLIIRIEVV